MSTKREQILSVALGPFTAEVPVCWTAEQVAEERAKFPETGGRVDLLGMILEPRGGTDLERRGFARAALRRLPADMPAELRAPLEAYAYEEKPKRVPGLPPRKPGKHARSSPALVEQVARARELLGARPMQPAPAVLPARIVPSQAPARTLPDELKAELAEQQARVRAELDAHAEDLRAELGKRAAEIDSGKSELDRRFAALEELGARLQERERAIALREAAAPQVTTLPAVTVPPTAGAVVPVPTTKVEG